MRDKMIELLKEKDRTRDELKDLLNINDRKLRQLRHDINTDNSKNYVYYFIVAKKGGGFSLTTDEEMLEIELKQIQARLHSYYEILRKISTIRVSKRMEHLF